MDRRKLSTVHYENFEKEPIIKLKRKNTELGGFIPANPLLDVLTPINIVNAQSINSSIEEKLIKTGSWALVSIRLPGYFPISTIETKDGLQLQVSCCSLVTLYTTIVTIISIFGSLLFYYTFIAKFIVIPSPNFGPIDPKYNCTAGPSAPPYGNVESFVWTSLLMLVTYTTYLRCSRIFYIFASLKFWKHCVSLFETLIDVGYNLNDSYFIEISRTIRKQVLILFVIGFTKQTYTLYTSILDLLNSNCIDLVEYYTIIIDLFLSFILFFHIGYSVWLTYWIKLFVMAFQTIHDDLDSIEDEDGDEGIFGATNNTNTMNGSNTNNLTTKSPENQTMEYKIRRTLSTYSLIEEHMHEFNSHFGVTIIFETMFTFTLLLVNVYCAFTYFEDPTTSLENKTYAVLGVIFPVAMYSFAISEFNSESSILSGKSTATLKKLDKFFIKNANRPQLQILQMKVLALIARVADNPPMISAGHFFSINRHLLTSMLGTVTTYLIVLLQFRGSSDDKNSNSTVKA